ncbi:MAG: hypothetical protein ACD_33C00045G0007 [uncultured bacterium]|nr:MAG: hypothetical protein ACD_33C00045G0007 [uncultured bacterium]
MNEPSYFFDRTDFFNRITALEQLIGISSKDNIVDVLERLTYLENMITTINAGTVTLTYVDNKLLTKLNKIGDTLLGNLELSVIPVNDNHVINKGYVDNVNSTIQTTLSNLQNIINVLNTDPTTKSYIDNINNTLQSSLNAIQGTIDTLNLDYVTKTYVDSKDVLKVDITGNVLTGYLTLHADPVLDLHPVTKQYLDTANTNLQTQITTLQNVTSTLNTDPVTKVYVDIQDALKVAKSGDTMSGFLTLNADPTNNLHASTKGYVDSSISTHINDTSVHLTSVQNTFIDGVTATYTEVNQLVNVTSNVQTQLDSKLPLTGGTLTGSLILATDPTTNLQATTKQYVDAGDINLQNQISIISPIITTLNTDPTTKTYVDNNDILKVTKSGDVLTGYLTLHADPMLALQPATKQYVDAMVMSSSLDSGIIIATPNSAAISGFLRCNGAYVDKIIYSNLYTKVGDKYSILDDLGNGKPWKHQNQINTTQSTFITGWNYSGTLPIALNDSQAIVTKNRVYLLGGHNGISYISTVYTCPINEDGTLGTWTIDVPLPAILGESQAILVKNRVYLLGGNNGIYVSTVYTAPINADGTLGTWTTSTPLPILLGDTQAIVVKNKVYILGGHNLTGTLNTVYSANINLDGSLSAWTIGTPLPITLGYSQAAVIKSYIYLFAGLINGTKNSNIYRAIINADGTLGTWVLLGNLPDKTQGHEIYVTESNVYLLALNNTNGNNSTNTTFSAVINYNGTLGAWVTSSVALNNNLITPLSKSLLITTASRIYLLGGFTTVLSNIILSAPLTGSYNDYTNLTLLNTPDINKFRLPDLFKREFEDKVFFHIKT